MDANITCAHDITVAYDDHILEIISAFLKNNAKISNPG